MTSSTPHRDFLRIQEAAKRLGISKNSAYQAAHRYLETGGAEGIPCIKLGGRYLVPAASLERWTQLRLPGLDD